MRYIHNIKIPVTTSVIVAVESDDPEPSLEDLYEAATTKHWRLTLNDDSDPDVELGDEVDTHKYLNRGNVCYAVCGEMELLDTEDMGDEDE